MVGLPGPDLDAETAERIESLQPAGVILFRRNLTDPRQTRRLLRDCAEALDDPPLLAIDQEGGRVSRLEPWIGPTPAARRLAGAADGTVLDFGRATGRVLRSIGFNLDFAPVVDLSPADADNGIGDRAFDTRPDEVSRLAGEFLKGLQGEGVAGCVKHFPGLGRTEVDSHLTLPTVGGDQTMIEESDLLPFERLAEAAPCAMVGHGHYPAFESHPIPATCSSTIVTGLLRERLGFEGVIVTDDMEMGAIRDRDVDGKAAIEATRAGCDLLLYGSDIERGHAAARALAHASRSDRELRSRIERSAERIALLAREWPVALEGVVPAQRDLAGRFEPFRRLA
jgi:beta-N-acetylhexosaminidase